MRPEADAAAGELRDFSASLPMVLLRAREAVMGRFRPSLRAHDVTEQQWRVLRALSLDEAVDVSALARRSCILMPSLSRILQNLEARGMLMRRPAPGDQRRALISLTGDGRRLLETVAPISEAAYAEIERCYGSDRLAALFAMLEQLEQALEVPAAGLAIEDGEESSCG